MGDLGDVTLYGVSAMILIPLIVQAAKGLGMADSFAPWLALGLSVLASVLATLLALFPQIDPVVRTLVQAVVMFLMVTGLYHTAKNVSGNGSTKDDIPPSMDSTTPNNVRIGN